MIVFKEDFIERYLATFNHKIRAELKERLENTGYFSEMVEKANRIVHDLTKEV
jgi:hypothetical protein